MCGDKTQDTFLEGMNRSFCNQCEIIHYQNPCPAVAVLLFQANQVLLVKRAVEPKKDHWALPAGFQELHEAPEQAARRELEEETGLTVGKLELIDLIYVNSSSMKPVNLAVFLGKEFSGKIMPGDDVSEAVFFPIAQLPTNLGFDHIHQCINRIKQTSITL